MVSWILYGTLSQKVGQVKVTDHGDPFQAGPFELICDGTDHTATMFFTDLSGNLYEPGPAFLVAALEIYDGAGTYTAREYRTVRLTR